MVEISQNIEIRTHLGKQHFLLRLSTGNYVIVYTYALPFVGKVVQNQNTSRFEKYSKASSLMLL